MPRLLHVLSQRPGRTGSGVTLEALVRHATDSGWEQRVICGIPSSDPPPTIGGLAPDHVSALGFDSPALPFPVPGMSDVMPYRSTVFSRMTSAELGAYRSAWCGHLRRVIDSFQPDIVHSHHIWLLSGWVRAAAGRIPVVAHCHATGLRQQERCPELAVEVVEGCARIDAFCVLHGDDGRRLRSALGVGAERIHEVGAGYREELFHRHGRLPAEPLRIAYAGKLSAAKGLPSLLDAFERLRESLPTVELHIAGAGDGAEALALQRRIEATDGVVFHGMLDQQRLAELFRSARVCVLPSFYEGLPLVLVEALACGCRIVATDLPGVREVFVPRFGAALRTVALPALTAIDRPAAEDLPAFAAELADALRESLADGELDEFESADRLDSLGWPAVCRRIETIWRTLLDA